MNPRYVALLLCALMESGCAAVKDNVALQQMANQDQYDRINNVANVTSHDAEHQRQLRRMVAARQVRTGNDYFNAALVFQHADSVDDHRLASDFAKKAAAKLPNNKAAQTLVAQAWDRYQRFLGLPQWYGTQRMNIGGREYLQPIDTTQATDAARQALFVYTLPQELAYFNKVYGKQETSVLKYVLTDAEQRRLEGNLKNGFELVGSFEELCAKAKYPAQAAEKGIAGFVLVEALVDEQGTVQRADVVQGLGHGCDEEAVRLMKSAKFVNTTGEPREIRMRFPFGKPAKP